MLNLNNPTDNTGKEYVADSNSTTDLSSLDGDLNSDLTLHNLDTDEQGSKKGLLGDLDLLRQVILVLAIAICVAVIVMLFIWVKEPEMRPLGTFDDKEFVQVYDFLKANNFHPKVNSDTNSIQVPVSESEKIKMAMTRAGMSTAPTNTGDELLLHDMGFGVSQRMEQARLKLAREQQLASAIEQSKMIRKAKVLIALPKESMFVRHNQEATASVFLTLATGRTLKQEEVDAIVDMVATAVPNLKPSKITVTDQLGRLLNSGTQDASAIALRKEYELQRQKEQSLREKIDALLIPTVGLGNYTAQVNVTLDFNAVEQTQKTFNPEAPATRSEFTLEDYNNQRDTKGIPGALSNQPPADSAIPQSIKELQGGKGIDQGSVHKEATRNFEIDTTIQHTKQQLGSISRQTISVAIKNRSVLDAQGRTTSSTPYSAEELTTITNMLKNAVGFTDARGDTISVVSMLFTEPQVDDLGNLPIWENPQFGDWVRWFSASLVIIIVVLVLVRPAMMKLLNPNTEEESFDLDGFEDMDDMGIISTELDDSFGLGGNLNLPNLHRNDDMLKAIRALVANEPELSAQVIKTWVEATSSGKRH